MAVICNSNVDSLRFCSCSNFDRPKGNQTFTWSFDTSKIQEVWYCTAKLKLTPSVWSGIFTRLLNCTFSSSSVQFGPRRLHNIGNIPLIIAHWHSETQENRKQGKERLPSMAIWGFHEHFALFASQLFTADTGVHLECLFMVLCWMISSHRIKGWVIPSLGLKGAGISKCETIEPSPEGTVV